MQKKNKIEETPGKKLVEKVLFFIYFIESIKIHTYLTILFNIFSFIHIQPEIKDFKEKIPTLCILSHWWILKSCMRRVTA